MSSQINSTKRTGCWWYDSKSCCDANYFVDSQIQYDCSFIDGMGVSIRCEEQLSFLNCGICSPNYMQYVNLTSGRFRICKKFAQTLWKECLSSTITIGRLDLEALYYPTEPYICVNPLSFFEDVETLFTYGFYADLYETDCFNSAKSLYIFSSFYMLLIVLLM